MRPFSFARAIEVTGAIATVQTNPEAKFIAGGTTLLDLMKQDVEKPTQLVDVNSLPFSQIENTSNGVRIGAMARMSDVAENSIIRDRFGAISQSLLLSASPQLRNMASIGGNLMQRTRCGYFRDPAFPCNKRNPGSGCPAMAGEHQKHAILGTSEQCAATHPSDLAVALVALDAVVLVRGEKGDRRIPMTEFHLLPGNTPDKETALAAGELIVAVEVPDAIYAARSHYMKIRDRASYEFALVAAAVGLESENGTIKAARIALGGVGTKPWRSLEAESFLQGKSGTRDNFRQAAEAALASAKPLPNNGYKVELAKRALVRALESV
ncbi:FAD binding domain-containing protein [Microseira sp. BLCC-F43]|uniref:FAD binding domain-containing protein n=1 Tax=Microseira sp. BLCC-F43 TaxID=3153602 RepID=UPI0035BB3951